MFCVRQNRVRTSLREHIGRARTAQKIVSFDEFYEVVGVVVMDCESCALFYYDEDYDDYVCSADMDEDDYGRLVASERSVCPYYRDGDEYKIVRHQI